MGSLEELLNHKKSVQENISKSFGSGFDLNEEWIQKARSGVYADTAENRKLNRVGQQYGSKKQEEQPSSGGEKKQVDSNRVNSDAAKASDEALKRAAADKNASKEVRNAAKQELEKRSVSGGDKKWDKVVDSKNKNDDKKAEKNDSGKKKAEDNKKDETKLSKREISKLERKMNKFKYARIDGSTVVRVNILPYDFSFGNISGNTLTIFANGKEGGDSKSYTREFEHNIGDEIPMRINGIPVVFYYSEPLQQLSNFLIFELRDKEIKKVKINFNLD